MELGTKGEVSPLILLDHHGKPIFGHVLSLPTPFTNSPKVSTRYHKVFPRDHVLCLISVFRAPFHRLVRPFRENKSLAQALPDITIVYQKSGVLFFDV